MATQVATARPIQALRQRRESARPGPARVNTRATTADAIELNNLHNQPAPYVITTDYILRKFAGCAPSLILHLHPTHFRFDQQDGNFGYNSEMRFLLEHVKNKTVPHEILEELFGNGVKFYDGCLIVEIHNHRAGADANAASATTTAGGSTQKPFSIHNYNVHITPSPYVPYPEQSMKDTSGKASEKQPMPAPDQPASAMQKKASKTPKVFTTVLFSTQSSLLEEMNILARTEYEKPGKRLLNGEPSKDGATPTPHPPTPLVSVPPTPANAKGSSKHPQMILTEDNAHEWEAEVVNRTAPPLFLEPAADLAHSQQLIEQWTHPLHCASPPAPKARKRTSAELAADEAQAASEERFMLTFDERHASLLASGLAGGAAETGHSGGSGAGTYDFKRFKTLENVRMHTAEKDRIKKEQEAHQAALKRQRQEAEQAKKRERAEQDRQMQQQSQQRQAQQENVARQQQMQQVQRAAAEHAQSQQQTNISTPATANPQQIPMSMSMPQASHLQASQSAQMSPINRQHTPMATSPVVNGTPMTSVPMTSVQMATSLSNQPAGSPARPPSAMQQHHQGVGMVRQQSQQHPGSTQGTPQVQNTPSMSSAVPVARHQTPTPRVNHGSPVAGHMHHSTPSMMPSQLATPAGQHITPEQRQQYMQHQRMARTYSQLQQGGQQITPQQQSFLNQFHIQQQQIQQQQQQQQRLAHGNAGTPTPQGGMQHNNSQAMQMQNSQMNNQQMQQMNGQRQHPNSAMANIHMQMANLKNNLQNQYMAEAKARQAQFLARFGGMTPPPEQMQQFSALEQTHKNNAVVGIDQRVQSLGKQLVAQAQERQRAQNSQMQGAGQQMGMMTNGGQNQQMMQNGQGMQMSNSSGGNMMVGQQNTAAQQAYIMNIQQQRQQMAARQRQLNMAQMGAQQGGQPQGMMNGMPNGMPHASNGNMGGQMGMGGAQMGMAQGNMGMGGGQMPQGMNGMPNTANMNPQQMMQLQQQMMAARQQQQMNMGQNGMGGMGGGMM
ncbi:hypothetical protein FKW77_006276 [Venturia effusa]|uniref:Spt20-like SEP domain-containing protein n=1 Tax=Venturia effusa TaxID=50376 RepID=A0A517LQF8_9PEZI|nr:hypothetical protein FKW77_006276 [Venturia effusa]